MHAMTWQFVYIKDVWCVSLPVTRVAVSATLTLSKCFHKADILSKEKGRVPKFGQHTFGHQPNITQTRRTPVRCNGATLTLRVQYQLC